MLDFDEYLTAKGCVVLKQYKRAEDRSICLVRCPGGSNAVWRCYDRPVSAYEKLIGIKCDELPEVYRYTDTECGGCLVEEEFIDGMPLAELIRDYHMDEPQTAAIARRVCKALAILHSRNMVHRDVKPENIFITSKGRVVLIDLDAVSPKDSTKERDTRLLGTVGYAAPEQYGFGHSDGRADIFGVGVLMNVLLTGKHPARQLADGSLRKVIEKCIAVNVDQRYASVEQLMEQLPEGKDKHCPDCGFLSPGGGCIFCGKTTLSGFARRKRRTRWLPVVISLLLVFAVGMGFHLKVSRLSDNLQKDIPSSEDQVTEQPENTSHQEEVQADVAPEVTGASDAQGAEQKTDIAEAVEPAVSPEADLSVSERQEEPESEEKYQPSAEQIPSEEVRVSPSAQPAETQTPQPVQLNNTSDFPLYTGDPVSPLTPFLYDLNGDGESEEYYFGFVVGLGKQASFQTKTVIRFSADADGYVTRKVAPAVWKQDPNGEFSLVNAFADKLQNPEISVCRYKGTDAGLSVQPADLLYDYWRGAVELRCGCGTEATWVLQAGCTLGNTKLSATMFAVVAGVKESVDQLPVVLTSGTPVGEKQTVLWHDISELVTGEYTVYDCTVQYLNNGYIRFVIDFIGPEGLSVMAFDPPNGALFRYAGSSVTTGEREQFVFDLTLDEVRTAGKLTVTFSKKSGSRFMVCFDDISGL